MAPTDMRGLTQYIADIRACRVRELEEKRINKEMAHIRQRFKEGNLDGYQKKKYLSKIVFTYILGYPVDIGHMEAVNLISSNKYSEKQIGYLALTLLMHENSDLVRLVVNSIRKDLQETNNETFNCLALHAIANIGGREMAESLGEEVYRLMISPTSPAFVKKKAALTLLRLYRKFPETIPAEEWALRIVSTMDDNDLAVALAVSSLVTTLAQDHLDAYSICYQKSVDRLSKIVIDQEYPTSYIYYKVPIPWLQVKLLRLLQYYPPSEDPTIRLVLHNVLQAILNNSRDTPRNVQHANAQNAILFEAINLAIHIDPESPVVHQAASLLSKFILSKETNVRYLGLDTMAHLAARSENLEAFKQHQQTIIHSLRDKDISVRRRGLDLLYSMCDTSNAKVIVGELLRYLGVADYALREEMVLKIAIMTEKFATEHRWYIDTILRLISQAGDYVGEEVWYRVAQIVTNTEEIQEYAARQVFDHLKNPTCHENLVKVAAYVLGEYGHLVANEPGFSPIEQFQALHSKSNICSMATRGLLLTTYLKWLNLFPEIHDQLMAVFQRYSKALDSDLQQRACEAIEIVRRGEDVLAALCDEMPPFPERESALLGRLLKKHGDAGDKRTWVPGGKDVNKEKDDERYKGLGRRKAKDDSASQSTSPIDVVSAPLPPQPLNGVATAPANGSIPGIGDDIMAGLAGLDMTSSGAVGSSGQEPLLLPDHRPAPTPSNTLSAPEANGTTPSPVVSPPAPPVFSSSPPPMNKPSSDVQLTHGADKWLLRLQYNSEGILFEDPQLQIGLKSEYHGHVGRLALFFGNKMPASLDSFTLTIDNPDPDALGVTLPKIPTSSLAPMTQIQQLVHVECKDVFGEAQRPILRVSYLAGSLQTFVLRLPIFLHKFIEPVKTLSHNDFFERWRQIGGPPREAQSIFPIKLTGSGGIDEEKNRKVIGGSRMGLLDEIDPNKINLVAAGVLHMAGGSKPGGGGKVGCLLRFEPNQSAKLARLTIRTTNENVSKELLTLLKAPLFVPQGPGLGSK